MLSFKEFVLNEKIINLFRYEEKNKYVDIVWDLLNKSYESIGGIKGSGFDTKETMIEKIKMWKLVKKNNYIVAGMLYKDRGMRKTIAVFTDGTNIGKKELEKILKDDFERSSIEVSHSLMKFIERKMPSIIKKYAIDTSKISDILNKDIEIIDKYHYKRNINGTIVTKMMLGSIKKFYEI